MKKVKSIQAGLIAAVLLASVSTSALGTLTSDNAEAHFEHWAPYGGAVEYFFMCTIGQQCTGSKWRD